MITKALLSIKGVDFRLTATLRHMRKDSRLQVAILICLSFSQL